MSVEIKRTSRELTKVERYRMTLSPEIKTMQDIEDGVIINVSAFCEFDDVNIETGEISNLLGILDKDGTSYVTQSATFRRSFYDIADIFASEDGYDDFAVKKISGKNKAGRPFVNCVLA